MQGESLGPYAIDRELGSGGMGRVYAATLSRSACGLDSGTRVALKVVHPHLLETEGFFKRFLREAEIGQSVRHANVVRTLDCDAIGGSHFLVMEYVEGQTLRDLAEELGNVPEELCRHVAREVAKGLGAIHAAGVVHRDIKPENVLITPDHVVKVMDLGVARLCHESIRLSQTGAFVGSLQYAAPESFTGGEDIDGRADLHALGLLLYELACGLSPYLADDVPNTVHKVLHEEPRRLGDANPQLSPFFEELVHCLLAKDRTKRFDDAAALLAVLDAGEESTWWSERASLIRAATKRPLRRIRIPRETAVYGRDDELAQLRALFEQATSGDGQVVLIEGEAGIGKSRLVDELVGRLQRDGEDLNFLFGSYPPSGAATAAGAWSTAFREHFGNNGSAEYLTETPLLVPAFNALLSGDAAPKDAEPLTKNSVGTCFVHASRGLARERTTIVLIEDLHFAPEEARGLFTVLALAVPSHRILLVGTTRPGVPEDWQANLTRLDHVHPWSLQRLGPKDLTRLLVDAFASERLAEELAFRIAAKSDGNPFFVFEILRGLREGQFITRQDDGTWISTRVINEIEIPSSVLDLVNARVADLTQEERDLLDIACCWGFEFDPALVADVAGEALLPTLKRFAAIEKKHRLVRAAGRQLVFDHHQVQEALYDALYPQMREAYHAALADALAARAGAAERVPDELAGPLCVQLCEHYLNGVRGEDAMRYLEAAQKHLTQGHLHAQVVTLTESALAVPELIVGADRARTLHRLCASGQPLDLLAERERQEACLLEAEPLAECAGDVALRADLLNARGHLLYVTARYAEAEVAYRLAHETAAELGDQPRQAMAAGNLALVLRATSRLDEGQALVERSLDLFQQQGDDLRASWALQLLGLFHYTAGRLEDALSIYQRCLARARADNRRHSEAGACVGVGNVLWLQGRFVEARAHFQRALVLGREFGDRVLEAAAIGNEGLVLRSVGRLTESRERLARHLELCRESGNRAGVSSALGHLGAVHHMLGRLDTARDLYEQFSALSRELGVRQTEAEAWHLLGHVAQDQEDTARAAEHLNAALALSEKHGLRRSAAVNLESLGALDLAVGAIERGRSRLVAARDWAHEAGKSGLETRARCRLACLPGGDAADALAAVAEHGDRLDADSRPEVFLLLWNATGDRVHIEEAKRLLDDALSNVPEEYHESMLTNRRVNREIMAAWKERGG